MTVWRRNFKDSKIQSFKNSKNMKTLYVIRITGRGCSATGEWSVGPLVLALIVNGRHGMKVGERIAGELRSTMEDAHADEHAVVTTKILSRTVVNEVFNTKAKENAE
jgi:hypothetical protein